MTTLARLAFWVPAKHHTAFAQAFATQLVPILSAHGLTASIQRGRTAPDGIFSGLFEVSSLTVLNQTRQRLRQDPVWNETLQQVAVGLDEGAGDQPLPYQLTLYQSPNVLEQEVPIRAVEGTWHTYSQIQASVITQDGQGQLWFGTSEGAYCFDGQHWSVFTASDGLGAGEVRVIYTDAQGLLWFGTDSGASCYDGQIFSTLTMADGLAGDRVFAILADRKGQLWFGTDQGLSRYDGQDMVTYTRAQGLQYNMVSCLVEDQQGDLWVGFGANDHLPGVCRYDGQTFAFYGAADGLGEFRVACIVEDRHGRLWFSSAGPPSGGVGMACYEGGAFRFYTTAEGLASNHVSCILEDREGSLWFGTGVPSSEGHGASCYDGTTFSTYTTDDGLAGSTVFCLFEDREGHLWFGTDAGVCRYDPHTWTNFYHRADNSRLSASMSFCDRTGRLWLGPKGKQLYCYDGHRWTMAPLAPLEEHEYLHPLNSVSSILQDRAGRLWFATTRAGLWCYDGATWTVYTMADGLASNFLRSLLEDRQGHLWCGCIDREDLRLGLGLCRFDGHTWTRLTIGSEPLPNRQNRINTLLDEPNGGVWVGTWNGLHKYDGDTWTTYTMADGLAHNNVSELLKDRQGRLWIGTWNGLQCYDGATWTTYTPRDGLADYLVNALWEDDQGHLWIGTHSGFSRYDGQHFQTLKSVDGLGDNVVWSISPDREKGVWLGASRFRPNMAVAPHLILDAVVADRRYAPEKTVRLPTPVEWVRFGFHAVSFKTRPHALVYRYRLVGVDSNWRTTHNQWVEYKDVPIGDYTFQVQAVGRDLLYSEIAEIELHVEPDALVKSLTDALGQSSPQGEFIGRSESLGMVQAHLRQAASSPLTVLIRGETGSGKGLAARFVHEKSLYRAGPFIQVTCGALPVGLIESELFGHERGAFTGAHHRKLGKVELAKEGTLFLDEIGDLSLEAQAKVLRLLEEGTFERVGGTETLTVRTRIVAATNRDLEAMVAEGTFREDLYFRLKVLPVSLPPLRQRREDIPLLALYFMQQMAAHLNKPVAHFTPAALDAMQAYAWPGNVRELEHTIQRAVILCSKTTIRPEDLGLDRPATAPATDEEVLPLEEVERRHILYVLDQTDWVVRGPQGAAALLGLPRSTLYSRMAKLGIQRPQTPG